MTATYPSAVGPAGKSVLNGTGVPSSGLGTTGDFYIDRNAPAIYGPKVGSAWGSPTSLIGTGGIGVMTSVNVRDPMFGAVGNGVADDTAEIQAAIDYVVAQGGGIVYLPLGKYLINGGLVVPPDVPIRLLGAGRAYDPSGGHRGGTLLVRNSGTATMIDVRGRTGTRAFVAIEEMTLYGGNTTGMGIFLDRCNNSYLHGLFIDQCLHNGLRLRQVYNSAMDTIWVGSCGNGATPAVLFDAYPTGQGACATVHCSNVEIEASEGAPLKLDGDSSVPSACANVDFVNLKIEATNTTGGAYPEIDLAYAQSCHFTNVHLNCPRKTVAPIQQNHPFGNPSGCSFTGLSIEISDTNPTYAIKNILGSLDLRGVFVATNQTLTAALRIESTTGQNAVKGIDTVRTNLGAVVSDARSTTDTQTTYGDLTVTGKFTAGGTVSYFGPGATLQSPTTSRFLGYENYNEALNAPKDASKPVWAWDLDGTADVFRVHRAPAGGVAFAVRFELPSTPTTLPVAATDLPSAIALVNAIRTLLINLKVAQ